MPVRCHSMQAMQHLGRAAVMALAGAYDIYETCSALCKACVLRCPGDICSMIEVVSRHADAAYIHILHACYGVWMES